MHLGSRVVGARTTVQAAVVLAGIAIVACGAATAQDRGGAFDAAERRALVAGELVRRNLSRREGGEQLFGGASWQRVRAPIERVWELATDARALTRLIPSLDEARIVEERGSSRLLYMHHSYGIGAASYYVRMDLDHDARSLRFRVDPSRRHDIRAGRGFLSLSTYRGDTIVAWGMLVDPGSGVVTQIFGPMLNEWLLLPPRRVRDELEGTR